MTRLDEIIFTCICFYALHLIGTLVLVENGRILWSLQVDHQLFSLAKLDVTVSPSNEPYYEKTCFFA